MSYSVQSISLCVYSLETQRAPGGHGVPEHGLPMRRGVDTWSKELVCGQFGPRQTTHYAFKREKANPEGWCHDDTGRTTCGVACLLYIVSCQRQSPEWSTGQNSKSARKKGGEGTSVCMELGKLVVVLDQILVEVQRMHLCWARESAIVYIDLYHYATFEAIRFDMVATYGVCRATREQPWNFKAVIDFNKSTL
eukprot:2068754-Amphidinium_carterae.1